MNFIEELYYGNIQPTQKRYNTNSQYAKALGKFCACESKLNGLLTDKELKIFTDLVNAHDDITHISNMANFKMGFRLGVQLVCDSVFYDKNQVFEDIVD